MSDAKVTFEDLGYEPAEPGNEQRFSFACPLHAGRRCEGLLIAGRTGIKHDGQGNNGGRPHWTWDSNREAPTFAPSVNHTGCWHGYIENGRCVNTAKQDEPEPK